MKKTLLEYIDFKAICKDHNLTSGDISPLDTVELENILQRFIDGNKPKTIYTITNNEKTINIIITFEGISKSFLEIEGRLNTYNTGRCEEYSFEPDWFSDAEAEEYYSNNWEAIEKIVLNQVNS